MASWKRPFWTALLVEALGLAGFFAAALVSFSADNVVPSLALRWEWAEALSGFFRWLPGLQFLSWRRARRNGGNRREDEKEDEELLSRAIVPAVLLSAAFSAIVILALPLLGDALLHPRAERHLQFLARGVSKEPRSRRPRACAIGARGLRGHLEQRSPRRGGGGKARERRAQGQAGRVARAGRGARATQPADAKTAKGLLPQGPRLLREGRLFQRPLVRPDGVANQYGRWLCITVLIT